jgi:hypothetical protein
VDLRFEEMDQHRLLRKLGAVAEPRQLILPSGQVIR